MAVLILPNQLFEDSILLSKSNNIYLLEDSTYFTKYPFHKMKLILHRASMKFYYNYVKSLDNNKNIFYINYNKVDYDKIFDKHKEIYLFDPIDHTIKDKFDKLGKKYNVILNYYDNQLFIETNEDLQNYYDSLKSHTRYIHDNGFYKWQRSRLNILMDVNNKPLFGKLSFDKDNRKPFSKTYTEQNMPNITNKYVTEAKKYVQKHFSNNFGMTDNFIFPIDFTESKTLFKNFIKYKLNSFGDFEDAVSTDINYGSHSVLSSSINIGIITIKYILDIVIKEFDKLSNNEQEKNIHNVEGFIRQIIGWRSYIRFIYKFHGKEMLNENLLEHTNKLSDDWYKGTTEIYPIDFLIKKVEKFAYLHHIERLMYIGNFALLSEIIPKDIYDWFMICFIDSYEWVMVANVMGMSQYSCKSIKMMTKPYFSSSNYIKIMSNYKLNNYNTIIINNKSYYWNDIWNALYYNFIDNNCDLLKKIYSTSRNVRHWIKKTDKEKKDIKLIAKNYLKYSKI